MRGVNYDSYINQGNPYDEQDYEEREREWLLKELEEFEGDEEAIQEWLRWHGYDDPRE